MHYEVINIPLFLNSFINENFEAKFFKNLFNLEKVRVVI